MDAEAAKLLAAEDLIQDFEIHVRYMESQGMFRLIQGHGKDKYDVLYAELLRRIGGKE